MTIFSTANGAADVIDGPDIIKRIRELASMQTQFSLRRNRDKTLLEPRFATEQDALDYLDRNDLRLDRFTTEGQADPAAEGELKILDQLDRDITDLGEVKLIRAKFFNAAWAKAQAARKLNVPLDLLDGWPFKKLDWPSEKLDWEGAATSLAREICFPGSDKSRNNIYTLDGVYYFAISRDDTRAPEATSDEQP